MKWRVCAVLLALGAVVSHQPAGAQGAQATSNANGQSGAALVPLAPIAAGPSTTFRTAIELVALNVTVTDGRDRFVKGLTKDDFAVFEDGVPQQLAFFAANEVPLDVAVMIDSSASMADKIAQVRQAATKFVNTLRPGDRAEVISFGDNTQVLVPFTSDKATVEVAIAGTTPRGSTALYNSLYIAISDLARLGKREGDVRRPAIIVLTDGDDTASMISFDDLLDSAKRSSVTVYAISIVSKTDTKRFPTDGARRFSTESDYALKTLAQETGGRAFFPLEIAELHGVYGQISEELSAQYSLGYSPAARADGSFHRLFVRVLTRDDVRPRTRTGYYATRTVRAAVDSR
jgi:Ca-activated chloride channel homolog